MSYNGLNAYSYILYNFRVFPPLKHIK